MIIDKVENASLYFAAVPGLQQFMQFYQDNDLEELPPCKIRLAGDDLFVMIQDFHGKNEADCLLESHKDYIDIQIPLTHSERMGWRSQDDCMMVAIPYDEEKDIEFYDDTPATHIEVPKGYFVVFFPSDAHQPGIAPGQVYRKIIVKSRDK